MNALITYKSSKINGFSSMLNFNLYKLIKQLTLLICATCFYNVCFATYDSTPVIPVNAADYLQNCTKELCAQNKLLATHELLKNHNSVVGKQVLDSIDRSSLTIKQQKEFCLLQANMYLQKNDLSSAARALTQAGALPTNDDLQKYYLQTIKKLSYKNNAILSNTVAKINLLSYTNNAATQKHNLNNIFTNLQLIKLINLKSLLQKNSSVNLNGWLELAIIAKLDAKNNDLAKLKTDLLIWRNKYPEHIANSLLPADGGVTKIITNSDLTVKNIALLLPLHGEFAQAGKAIENGFLKAYFTNLTQDNIKNIKVYDTTTENIVTLYQKVLQDKPNFIIGPLEKNNVKEIANIALNTPTLALNYLKEKNTKPNLLQFGMATKTQISQIAQNMRYSNVNSILLITPDNKLGEKIKAKFTRAWIKLHGSISATLTYKEYNFAKQIGDFLRVNYSKNRIAALKNILNLSLQTAAKRRDDFDGIFFFANTKDAKIINPLLKFNYSNNIKVFSLNNIYDKNQPFNQDLDNIRTVEYPAVIKNNINDFTALGSDCYKIANNINKLIFAPNFMLQGATGKLYLTANGKIYQKLLPVTFINGKPKLVSIHDPIKNPQ